MIDPLALWVVPVPDLGGVARHVLDVARTGVPGWRVFFAVPEGVLAERLRDAGAPVLALPFGPGSGLKASIAALRRTIETVRPSVVHTHLAYADVVGAIATRGLPVRLVSTEHGIAADDLVYHGSRARAAAMANVHRVRVQAFDGLIAVSNATRDVMRAKWRARKPITVIPNGVDRPARTPPTPARGHIRVASIARLSPEKRTDALLEAFTVLRQTDPAAVLTVAGDGPLKDDLVRQARELGVSAQIEFPGFVAADELLARTDVLVQLSVWENCSYTLLDACAAGVGVVATPVGGNPEILPAQCLVDAHDTRRLAETIRLQAAEPGLRPSLPDTWPTVSDMTTEIADVYRRVAR